VFRPDLCKEDVDAWVRHGHILVVVANALGIGVRTANGAASDDDILRACHDFGLGDAIEIQPVGLLRVFITAEAAGAILAGVTP
jgi:hypothetical protein